MTPGEVITEEVALGLLSEVIEGREHYIYDHQEDGEQFCVYFDRGGKPSCIVGHVAAKAGLPTIPYGRPSNSQPLAVVAMDTWPGAFDTDAIALLAHVQTSQDNGTPWGQSVADAREELG